MFNLNNCARIVSDRFFLLKNIFRVLFIEIHELIVAETIKPRRLHLCVKCGRSYVQTQHLSRHLKYECGMPAKFSCQFCPYHAKRKDVLKKHLIIKHAVVI